MEDLRQKRVLGLRDSMFNGTLMGTPNREPQEYSRNLTECKDPGRCLPIISYYILGVPCLGFPLRSL